MLHPEIERQLKLRRVNYFYHPGGKSKVKAGGYIISVESLFLAVKDDDPILQSDFLNSFCSIFGGSLFTCSNEDIEKCKSEEVKLMEKRENENK